MQVVFDLLYLGHIFKHEQKFVSQFARGNTEDVISLNVNDTLMAVKRSTLQTPYDSVLAQQFDDAKWAQQRCKMVHVLRNGRQKMSMIGPKKSKGRSIGRRGRCRASSAEAGRPAPRPTSPASGGPRTRRSRSRVGFFEAKPTAPLIFPSIPRTLSKIVFARRINW